MKTSSCSFGIHLSCPISSLSSKAVSLKFNKETSDAARRLRVGGSLRELSGDFIAGLVTSDGVFSALLVRRGNKNNYRFRIDLKFTIQLSRTESNKNLLLGLKEKFDNKGNFILYKKQNNTILYQITNQKDLLNVVIPFFMNYQLRGEKLLSFLRFKYILESVLTKSHLKDKNIFLSLIVIGGQCNPQEKLGEKIRYLKPAEAKYVINNIIPEGVDISSLTNSLANVKPNPLTLDFVRGLFESNTDNFWKLSKQDQDYIRENFLPKGLEHWKFEEYYKFKDTNNKFTPGSPSNVKSLKVFDKRSYSTKQSSSALNPNFISGFVDGEGSFIVHVIRRSTRSKIGWVVDIRFSIELHQKDRAILELIRSNLGGIGKIYKGRENSSLFAVTSLQEMNQVLFPFFEMYPLITQKKADFILFKETGELMVNKQHLTLKGLEHIVSIRASINKGMSDDLKQAFPNIVPVKRPLIVNQVIKDPNWLVGFISAEGCFYINLKNNPKMKTGYSVELVLTIVQHSRDEALMRSLKDYLDCGKVYVKGDRVDYKISKLKDLSEKVLPLIQGIKGVKSLDFEDFKKVMEIMEKGLHLTSEGIDQIRQIKAGMNWGRA